MFALYDLPLELYVRFSRSICVIAWMSNSLLSNNVFWLAVKHFVDPHIVAGHLGCFLFWGIMGN